MQTCAEFRIFFNSISQQKRKQPKMTTTVGFAEISTHILIENIIAEIKEQYLADDTPWIVGFSGGKDSTTLLKTLIFLSR